MYARTRKGICKILETYKDICLVDKNGTIHSDSSFNEYIRVEDIIKSDKDIIGLIEVGDYVNGNKVIRIETSSYPEDKNVKIIVCCGNDDYYSYYNEEIKTILTKEQYENNCYKVEDK